MKEKSRFVSSVIVSLLAGFIYYQFSGNITGKINSSVKAIFSSVNEEMYGPYQMQSYSSIIKKSPRIKNNKKLFIKSKNSVAPVEDVAMKNTVEKYARFVKPIPDRNVDYTAELDKLMNKNDKDIQGSELKLYKGSEKNEIADNNESQHKVKMYIKKENYNDKGLGFEYNIIVKDENSEGSNEYNSEFRNGENKIKIKCNSYKTGVNQDKNPEAQVPVIKVKIKDKMEKNTDEIEIFMHEDEFDNNTM